jgi:hypothetical protein
MSVMAGLVPAIHAFVKKKGVDARHKAGHDETGGNTNADIHRSRARALR